MKGLIRITVIAIIAILVYNYFFGTAEEKQSSEKIFNEFVDLGKAVGDLIKTEKEKFDRGKYDDVLAKITDFIDNLKSTAEGSVEAMEKIQQLEARKEAIEEQIAERNNIPSTRGGENIPESYEQQDKNLDKALQDLMRETEKVVNDLKEE